MDDEPELREKVTRSLPPRLAGLLESGLVAIELRSSKLPTNHALTVYRKGDFRFTILLRSETVRAAGEAAIRGLIRHELGHIFLGHFADSHLECQRLCNTLAEEAEVNYYVPREELMAIDAVATRLLQEFAAQALGEDAARILAAAGGLHARAVYPEEVAARAGLSPDLPPLWRLLHPLLHPWPEEEPPLLPGGEGQEAGLCGGVQVDADALAEAMGVAAAIASSPRGQGALSELQEQARSWGSGQGRESIPWQMPSLPPWAQKLAEWARRLAEREWRRRRSRLRPRLDVLRSTGRYLPDWGRERRRKEATVVLAVDTSGSMAQDLHYARPAVEFLLAQGFTVRFICGDVEVTVDELLRPGSPIPDPAGGGGTDICPLVERAQQYSPKGIAIYTDAAIPRWPPRPEGASVLWIVPAGARPPYGEVAHWRPAGGAGPRLTAAVGTEIQAC